LLEKVVVRIHCFLGLVALLFFIHAVNQDVEAEAEAGSGSSGSG